jgi:hypothetical protein
MESIQASLREGDKVLATVAVNLTKAKESIAGSFTLPRCSINMGVRHQLDFADGRSIPIAITRLSHFSGDVEFVQATPA